MNDSRRIYVRFGLSVAVVLLAAGAFALWFMHRDATARAQAHTAERTQFAARLVTPRLGPAPVAVMTTPRRIAELDGVFMAFGKDLRIANIVRRDGTIVYSTRHELIGTRLPDPTENWSEIAAGRATHQISHMDAAGKEGFGPKVLESLAPLLSPRTGRPIAALEVYDDYAPVDAELASAMRATVLGLLIAMLLLFGALFPILRRLLADRRRGERDLAQSESRLRNLLEQLPFATYVVPLGSPEQAAQYVSPQIETLLGYTPAEWIADPRVFVKSVHPDDRERVLAAAFATRESNADFSLEYRLIRKDGEVVWVLDEMQTVRDEGGRPLAYQGMLMDLTERRSAEHAIRRYADVARSMEIGLCVLELERPGEVGSLRLTEANPATERHLGVSASSLLGRRIDDLLPDYRQDPLVAALDGSLSTGQTHELEYRWEQQVVAVKVLPLGPRRVGLLFENVTGRREAEEALEESKERFKAAFDSSPVGMTLLTPDGHWFKVNPAFCELTGYSEEELLSRTVADLTHPDDVAASRELAARLAAGEIESYQLEKRGFRKDGSEQVVDVAVAAVRNPDGTPRYFVSQVRDVTEQKRLEAQLLNAQRMETVGRLAGGIAHDFNNLLTAIGGYSELLLRRLEPDDDRRRDVEEIRAASDRAASLTGQLLAFSRRQVLQPRVLDVNESVAEIEHMLRRLIGEDIDLRTVLAPAALHVQADPGQVEQVLLNLVVNARDAMPRGGTLTIETGTFQTSAGAFAIVAVTDTGVGIDDETRGHLFEPFFTTKRTEGTGLGLATVYGIVQQSGGFIDVDSEVGVGSSFRVHLPLVEAPAPAEATAAGGESPRGIETVLLVEDEDVVRSLVREMLESQGYDVIEAADGNDAVDRCRAFDGEIDLLVTDVVMPGLSGPETADRIAALRPGIGVLFASGYTDAGVMQHGVLDEGIAYLQKPFTWDELARKVRRVLDERIGVAT